MNSLKQKRHFNTKTVDFKTGGIQYSSGNILNSHSIFIPYNEIEINNYFREFKTDKFNLFVAIVSLGVLIKALLGLSDNPEGLNKGLWPLALLFFIVFTIATLLSRKHLLFIPTQRFILELYDNNPSEKEMTDFIQTLENNVKEYNTNNPNKEMVNSKKN
ncbi:hypothetical protein JBL43_06055 [Aureibaculum sp. A20]|uniref:Uncharacterized protein n=1 Tax=Aureibaculum flavum TaxID=2795986 RepID=A0ABS0WPJ6_9FLAO|nr:hypothetical protein [Aureibaculum flavum]MBJ2173793.1 hypothetical protein [Aureibaculum flavum]